MRTYFGFQRSLAPLTAAAKSKYKKQHSSPIRKFLCDAFVSYRSFGPLAEDRGLHKRKGARATMPLECLPKVELSAQQQM